MIWLCPACEDAFAWERSMGPSTMERALFASLDALGQKQPGTEVRGLIACGGFYADTVRSGLPAPRPNAMPFDHIDLESVTAALHTDRRRESPITGLRPRVCVRVGHVTPEELPTYSELILPTVRAVITLGGSATSREVTSQVVSDLAFTDEMLAVPQPSRPGASVLLERAQWARSYAKMIGALESPKRGVFLVTPLGKELVGLPDEEGKRRTLELDRELRRNRRKQAKEKPALSPVDPEEAEEQAEEEETLFRTEATATEPERWQDVLLARLHRLTPDAFEEFALYLLRLYGLELERVGGSGDEGIDGIGIAPLSPVLSTRVAVQVKRYDPNGKPVGRETVALFQRDAQTKGAERAILVTLGKFTEPARKAAIVTSPTVDLIDGERLAALVKEQGLGVKTVTKVEPDWFNRFG